MYNVFKQKEIKDVKRGGIKIKCAGNGALANGLLLEDGKVLVLKGSTAVKENIPSSEKHNYRNIKDKLIKINRLVEEDNFLRTLINLIAQVPSLLLFQLDLFKDTKNRRMKKEINLRNY